LKTSSIEAPARRVSYLMTLLWLARAAGMAWLDRRAASKGAALTLYVLFSLAPMLILLVALASLFFDEETVRTALLTELGSLIGTQGGEALIGLYLGHGNFSSSYGAAGSIVALITWIYYSAQIFFFGALFTHEYATTLGSRRQRGGQA
jgi:membrane protein